MERVAGILDVGISDDFREVVIDCSASLQSGTGAGRILLSPRYARYLANLLIDYAEEAETHLMPQAKTARRHGS